MYRSDKRVPSKVFRRTGCVPSQVVLPVFRDLQGYACPFEGLVQRRAFKGKQAGITEGIITAVHTDAVTAIRNLAQEGQDARLVDLIGAVDLSGAVTGNEIEGCLTRVKARSDHPPERVVQPPAHR